MRRDIGPCAPSNVVQVVGDVHGCAELMHKLFGKLDLTEPVVMVGDYVDRGQASAETLSVLKRMSDDAPDLFICLKGNHEVMLLEFLDDPTGRGRRWLDYGGLDTILSFAISSTPSEMSSDHLLRLRDDLQDKMGAELIDWVRNLPLTYVSGNLVVAHAGMDPKVPFDHQTEQALLWGRSSFLDKCREDDLWVAYGHNVYSMPFVEDGRVAVDTGAYHSGRLTAAVFHMNGEIEFVQTRAT